MKPILLKQVKKGEAFKFRPSETAKVYVRDDYDRETKKYEYFNYFNVCEWSMRKGTCIVYVDFRF